MNPFTRNFVCGRLDKETSAALISLESSYGFTIEVEEKKEYLPYSKYPTYSKYSWAIDNKNDWRCAHFGFQDSLKAVKSEMETATENILLEMGETKRSIVMKSRLKGGK